MRSFCGLISNNDIKPIIMNKIEQRAALRIAIIRVRHIYENRLPFENQAKFDAWKIYNRWLHAMRKERVQATACADLIFENAESRVHYIWLLGYDPNAKRQKNVHNSPKNN